MDRLKNVMLHPINEIKARKRKASPSVIDLTRPTQKRTRSAGGSDIIVLDEPTETSQPTTAGVESHPGRPPSLDSEDGQPLAKADVMERMLKWSRLSMKQLRSAPSRSHK